jgi:hypothetical protein
VCVLCEQVGALRFSDSAPQYPKDCSISAELFKISIILFRRSCVRSVKFNIDNPSSRTMVLGSTQPLTEMSTRNLPGGKGLPAGA